MRTGNSLVPNTAMAADAGVLAILRAQHAEIGDLLAQVAESSGVARQQSFDVLREQLALHESTEQLVLRFASRTLAPEGVASARNGEERHIADLLARLEKLDVDSAAFTQGLGRLGATVVKHMELEETEEFPAAEDGLSADEQAALGRRIARVIELAPTRPHPAIFADATVAQWTVGPYAALRDRAAALVAAVPAVPEQPEE